jgi:nucleoprotein TPR
LQFVREEAAQLNVRYTEVQRALESERVVWLSDKKTLEDTIVDMSTSEKHSESDRSLRETEAHRQEERANVCYILSLRIYIFTKSFTIGC